MMDAVLALEHPCKIEGDQARLGYGPSSGFQKVR
jgi:hypothetical protein